MTSTKQEGQTPQDDQGNLVCTGQRKKSVSGETFLKPPGRGKNPHTTHAIMKSKHTDVYIKPKIKHRIKLFRGKNGGRKNRRGIQTSVVFKT